MSIETKSSRSFGLTFDKGNWDRLCITFYIIMAYTIDRAKNGSIGIFTRKSPIGVIFEVLSSKQLSIFIIYIEFSNPYLLGGDK